MKAPKASRLTLITLFGLAPLAACDTNDGPAEETGEAIDEAAEETEDAIDDAADDIDDGVDGDGTLDDGAGAGGG